MATEISFTDDSWVLLTDVGFVGQKRMGSIVELTDSVDAPLVDAAFISVETTVPQFFPAPAAGSWYARVRSNSTRPGTAKFTLTEA